MKDSYDALRERYENKGEDYYDQQRPEMLEFIPPDAKTVLDVGCSGGGFGELLKQIRPSIVVWGIEPDVKATERASKRLDRVINGVFTKDMPELDSKKFDCIVFNDVLEHMAEPSAMLSTARDYLDSDGVVVASIPNILHFYEIANILLTQDWKYRSEGILDNTHLRFFTKKSIIRMFEEEGYQIDEITGINPSFGLKFQLANALLLGNIADWKFMQFALRGRPRQ